MENSTEWFTISCAAPNISMLTEAAGKHGWVTIPSPFLYIYSYITHNWSTLYILPEKDKPSENPIPPNLSHSLSTLVKLT